MEHVGQNHLIDKSKYQPNSKVIKLHYEKYSPLFRDDFKELEIFLDEIVPLLESDEENQIFHDAVYSDGDFKPHSIHDFVDLNNVSPIVTFAESDKPILHDFYNDVYVSPFYSPKHISSYTPSSSPISSVTLKPVEHKQENYLDSTKLKDNKYFSGLIPHAINIQINIPPSDDRKYKESDSYREHKHIAVTGKPGYKSPLNGESHYESTPAIPLPPALPSYNPTQPPPLPSYNPTVSPKLPGYKTSHSTTTLHPHLLPHHPHPPSHSYEVPHKSYLPPPQPHYEAPTPPSYEVSPTPGHLIRDFKPPHAEYLPPSPAVTVKPHYEPPVKEYLPPKLPSYHGTTPSPLVPDYKQPSKSYLPPSSEYIPPDHHLIAHEEHHPFTEYHPPSKDYLPPPPHHHHSKPGYEPPSKEYLPPPHHDHHAVKPGYEPPSKEYLPPHSHHPVQEGYDHMKPPTRDYLPPADYIPPHPELITDIDGAPLGLLNPPNKDYLPPPPRIEAVLDKEYVPPPPRSKDDLTVQLNSHIGPPRGEEDHYIPPKTLHDVPKNFIRPDDILPPPPELLDVDYLDDLNDLDDIDGDDIEITLEDLESLGLPGLESLGLNDLTSVDHPFLGLAKFRDGRPKSDEKRKSNRKKQKETIKLKEDDRLEKLRLAAGEGGLPFPPMPTTAPDSLDSVPIIERLRPEVLAQLRQAQATGGGGGGPPGFIPGKAGVDYPDFRSIPATDFTCENFILPGFYADTFTSCQVKI